MRDNGRRLTEPARGVRVSGGEPSGLGSEDRPTLAVLVHEYLSTAT